MADYAIGDVQGCYDPLLNLLDHVHFDDRVDRLWFVGDLVNRGPKSLAVLRFIRSLPIPPRITLGNHDLHLLASLFGGRSWQGADDTFQDILQAEDGEDLGHWLRTQSIAYYCSTLNVVMCHAGIAPLWDIGHALKRAHELESALSGPNYRNFLSQLYGNKPDRWSEELSGLERLRAITNYFTRMRFCYGDGQLELSYKGSIDHAPKGLFPWYAMPGRVPIEADIVFGHWAALRGLCPDPKIYALDTGCLWGGSLTALRLQDKQRFTVGNQA